MSSPAAFLSPRAAGVLLGQADAARRRPQRLQPQQRYPTLPEEVDNSSVPVPVIVTGGDSLTGYTVDVYGNGLGAAATAAALMDPLNIAYADTVPADGTFKLWVLPSQLMAVGDGT